MTEVLIVRRLSPLKIYPAPIFIPHKNSFVRGSFGARIVVYPTLTFVLRYTIYCVLPICTTYMSSKQKLVLDVFGL